VPVPLNDSKLALEDDSTNEVASDAAIEAADDAATDVAPAPR